MTSNPYRIEAIGEHGVPDLFSTENGPENGGDSRIGREPSVFIGFSDFLSVIGNGDLVQED